jgi:hypothetical protein
MSKSPKIDIMNDFTDEEIEALAVPKPTLDAIAEDSTLPTDKKIAMCYSSGIPVKPILDHFDISAGRLYDILSREGVQTGRFKASKSAKRIDSMTAKEKQDLINDYRSGMQMNDIFDKYDINKHGCYSVLNEHKVPRRQNYKPKGQKTKKIANEMLKNIAAVTPTTTEERRRDILEAPIVKLTREEFNVKKHGPSLRIDIKKNVFKTEDIESITVQLKYKE